MWVETETGELDTVMAPRDADPWRRSKEVWGEFLAAPTTLGPTPGERERWHRGRARYAVWALRIDAAPVAERALRAQRLVDGWVRPLAMDDLHVTVHVAGFPTHHPRLDDDVAESALAAQAAAVRGCLGRPLRLDVGGANAFRSAAVLDVSDPRGDLADLKRRLADVAPELRFGPYDPHVTVGCFVGSIPTVDVARRLAALRSLEPLALEIPAVDLVELDAAVEGASLETRLGVPLTPGAIS